MQLARIPIRDAGGMAFSRCPIYLRASRRLQSFLGAAMLCMRDGLMSVYRACAVMFYAILAVVIATLLGWLHYGRASSEPERRPDRR